MSLKPGEIIGKFCKIIDQLGEGGFAKTYLAEDLGKLTKPPCVVKEIKASQYFDAKEIRKRRLLYNLNPTKNALCKIKKNQSKR